MISIVLKYTKYGRNVYSVGSNEYAARLAGINTTRIKFLSYVISGVTASLAGVVLVAQLSLGRDDAGLGSELEVITAVVLGVILIRLPPSHSAGTSSAPGDRIPCGFNRPDR